MSIKSYIKKVINTMTKMIYKRIYKLIPVDNKTILFVAFHGKGYLCNPKYIHKYLLNSNEYSEYRFVWAVKNKQKADISNARVVKYNGIMYFYYLARSKYWVFNCKMPKYILKKESQVYLQTWHGTPLKRLAHDIHVSQNTTFYRSKMTREDMVKTYDVDSQKYDYFLSPNEYSTNKFISAFKINKDIILEEGYPRNDVLFNPDKELISKVKNKYNIPLNKKVILYAPTWRDNSFNTTGYTFEVKVDFDKWFKHLGEEYVVIFKPHYLISNKFDKEKYSGFVFSIDEDEDINDLYLMSDMLITDYSSVFFDYANLKRPILFYMYDLECYKEELRGFYLNIQDELPGDIFICEESLINAILKFKYNDEFYYNISTFNSKYNNLQDGNCTKRVVEKLINSEKEF